MGDKTGIERTDATWDPVTGCAKVSQGCKNCYAERVFPRAYGADRKFTDVRCHPDRLDQPLRWHRPRRVFVNSMSDLFHENVPDDFIDEVFGVMALAAFVRRCRRRDCEHDGSDECSLAPPFGHTFQILTKRPERARDYVAGVTMDRIADGALSTWGFIREEFLADAAWPLPNVWLGVSVEDQSTADERIPVLLETPAAVRFVSAEPLLGPVDLRSISWPEWEGLAMGKLDALVGGGSRTPTPWKIDWVICGGESGPNARPMHPDWARSIRDQCVAAGVPFLMKQWGEWLPFHADYPGAKWVEQGDDGSRWLASIQADGRVVDTVECDPDDATVVYARVGKKLAGRELDGRTWDELPEPPKGARV